MAPSESKIELFSWFIIHGFKDCQLHNEDMLTGFGPKDQIWPQVGCCDFRWEGEPLSPPAFPSLELHSAGMSLKMLFWPLASPPPR